MIEEILPPGVAVATLRGDDPRNHSFAEEQALVSRAVISRRQEFISGRTCARRALLRLGETAGPILRGEHREPLWPHGIVGSITHCSGYRAAAVARVIDVMAIGIDAEPHDALPAGVLQTIALDEEQTWLASAPPAVHWDRILFSAKESIYKAWFPLTGRPLNFDQASVRLIPPLGTFRARLNVCALDHSASVFDTFDGRFLVRDGLVVTAVVVPRRTIRAHDPLIV